MSTRVANQVLKFSFATCLALSFAGPLAAAEEVRPASTPIRFALNGFSVSGNTLLAANEVTEVLQPYTGDNRDFGDIQQALEALEERYRTRGYSSVVVLLPEQKLSSGVVRLVVVEGRITQIQLRNDSAFSDENILAALPSLKIGEVAQAERLSANMLLANENGFKQTSIVLKAGENDGDLVAEVNVTGEKVWRVVANVDNTGTRATGLTRLGVGLQYGNLFNRDHTATLQYQTSPGHWGDIAVFGAGYRLPVYDWGGYFEAFAGKSRANVGNVGDLFTVAGSGEMYGLSYTQILPNIGGVKQRVRAGLDMRHFVNSVVPTGQTSSVVPNYSVSPVSLTYSADFESPGLTTGLWLSYARNSSLFAGDNANAESLAAARTGARYDYDVFRGGINSMVLLPADWRLRLQGSAQFAATPLVPGEQFGLGGAASVRGFDERTLSNDSGVRGSLELYTPELAGLIEAKGASLRFLTFVDGGTLWRNYAQPDEVKKQNISSAGIGLRLVSGNNLSLGIDWGYVLDGTSTYPRGTDRIHAALTLLF